jgi:hypothetical protein
VGGVPKWRITVGFPGQWEIIGAGRPGVLVAGCRRPCFSIRSMSVVAREGVGRWRPKRCAGAARSSSSAASMRSRLMSRTASGADCRRRSAGTRCAPAAGQARFPVRAVTVSGGASRQSESVSRATWLRRAHSGCQCPARCWTDRSGVTSLLWRHKGVAGSGSVCPQPNHREGCSAAVIRRPVTSADPIRT